MEPLRILLLTPPMTQVNTPYPATAYLTGCLRRHLGPARATVAQHDAGLSLFLRLFSGEGLQRVLAALPRRSDSAAVAHLRHHGARIVALVDPVVALLQGRDPSLALRIVGRELLPEGGRFAALQGDDDDDPLAWAFGQLGVLDRAKHLASLFIDDIADAIRDGIDADFELSRYGERLAASAPSFAPIRAALDRPPTLVDTMVDEIADALAREHQPQLVGLTVPFPGNLLGALRLARRLRAAAPSPVVALGGGYVNTELRELAEPALFDLVDYVTLDDGERPLLALIEHLRDPSAPLLRTMVREAGRVVVRTDPSLHDLPMPETGTPCYDGLALDRYVSLVEMLNPMHRLWSDGRWNKLTVAHGCYWKKCSFCDVTLDYIARYEPAAASLLHQRVVELVEQTGSRGFHFVDEAAPPAGLRALAERLVEHGPVITWWGNIRFEKAFTPELVGLLARSGCVAVSGGLEVASDALLARMNKGVTVAQVARVTHAFTEAGIMVHAYLMYGFPGETVQDTVDALERVRQLFAAGCVQSAFWHRFAATAHSPIGRAPQQFGIRLREGPPSRFARNELAFEDPVGTDHDALAPGLRAAIYNYMHGLGLDEDVRSWFRADGRRGVKVPRTQVPADFVARALVGEPTARGGRHVSDRG
ncbi:MAG: radical SAM protein [Nannocystaceae bacterium]|nr:radical SAM protein [Nannocystaceae bacterium]